MAELAALFGAAFLAATLLPGGSEILLVAMDRGGEHPDWLLLTVASAGNTLGSMTSWLIGRLAPQPEQFAERHARALTALRRHGAFALLLAWVPIIGDPLALAAGWLRIGFWPALLFTAIGKTARYAVIVLLA
ncbi:MAG: YqaA family protein [Pseudomonadota bacterium]